MKRAARVLVVSNMWPGEGSPHVGVFVQRQVEALRTARPAWTFDVATIAGPRGRSDYLRAAFRLRRMMRTGRYDLAHAHYGLTGLSAVIGGVRPLVLTLHGGEIEVPWQTPLTRLAMRRSAAVIAVSEWVRSRFADTRMRVIPCGVQTDVFVPGDRATARQRLGLPADAAVVLFPADPREPIKDHALYRAAMERVRHSVPDAVELTLGVPPAEVPQRMVAADLVMVTSRMESGPLVVKEALACGVPVVSVDVGDVRETTAGVPGCEVVDTRDAHALALAAARVLQLPGRGRDASLDAARRRRIAELHLDDGSVAGRVLEVYDDVLAGAA